MPVLGAAIDQFSPLRGCYVPKGSLDVWRSVRSLTASQLVEVVVFGDSTTWGSTTSLGVNNYSWTQKLRALFAAAGYTDGGRGLVYAETFDTTPANGDPVTTVVSRTGFTAGAISFSVRPGAIASTTLNDTITLQGVCTAIRIQYSKLSSTGPFTYAVDGGAPVTVTPGTTATSGDVIQVSGLALGTHTLTVVNTGGATVAFNADFVKSVGLVIHKDGTSGASTQTYFQLQNPSLGAYWLEIPLGLVIGTNGAATAWQGTTKAASPPARNVRLAISALGVNDLQGLTIASSGTPTTTEQANADRAVALIQNNVTNFVRLCRAGGIDPLIVIPHFDLALHGYTWGGQFAAGLHAIARGMNCAVVDFNEAIRPISTMVARGLGAPAVHATVETYDAEAKLLFDLLTA